MLMCFLLATACTTTAGSTLFHEILVGVLTESLTTILLPYRLCIGQVYFSRLWWICQPALRNFQDKRINFRTTEIVIMG